jgi:SAM-dependent methyltransferase
MAGAKGASETPGGRFGGYWADTTYVDLHHRAQEPWRIALEARRVGGAHPDLAAPYVYCDIGCGAGITLIGIAAANPHGQFHGVDINPAHIEAARRMAAAAGLTNIRFHEGAAEALPADAIPACDFVAAFGVFSWVSPEVTDGILAFASRTLKPDGLFLASMNLESGWAQMRPVRRYLLESHHGASGSGSERLRAAIDAAQAVFGAGTDFSEKNPIAKEALESWKFLPRNYIPHEWMNETWRLFTVREAFDLFEKYGFAYAGA